MKISKVEFVNRKPHLRYDNDSKTWVGYRIDVRAGRKRHRNTFKTKSEAERFVDELRNKQTYRTAGLKYVGKVDVTLADLFAKRLKRISNPKEVIRSTRVFALFESIFDAPPKVTEVRKAHLQKYINKRLEADGYLGRPVKPSSVDREVTVISAALKQAGEIFPEELEDYEPPQIPRPSYSKKKRKHKHIITAAEMESVTANILSQRLPREHDIRTANRQVTAWIFEIGWLLGFRLSEALGILKERYHRDDKRVDVIRFKTTTFTSIRYLPDRVIEIMDAAAAASVSDRVFDLTTSENTFTDIIIEACRAAGLTYGREFLDGVTFHSTRHAFTSRLVQHTDIATAGEYTAHSSGKMVEYYSQPSEDSKRLAMERMYGNGKAEELTEIYKKIRSRKMTLEAFLDAIQSR